MTDLYQRSADPDSSSFGRELPAQRVAHAGLDEATGPIAPALSHYDDERDALSRSDLNRDRYLNRRNEIFGSSR